MAVTFKMENTCSSLMFEESSKVIKREEGAPF